MPPSFLNRHDMSPSAVSSGPNGSPLPFFHRSHWSPPFRKASRPEPVEGGGREGFFLHPSHPPLFQCFSFFLPCHAVALAKAGVFWSFQYSITPMLQYSILPSFFLTSIRFPYRFSHESIRCSVHQQLNLSSLPYSTYQPFLLFIIRLALLSG